TRTSKDMAKAQTHVLRINEAGPPRCVAFLWRRSKGGRRLDVPRPVTRGFTRSLWIDGFGTKAANQSRNEALMSRQHTLAAREGESGLRAVQVCIGPSAK